MKTLAPKREKNFNPVSKFFFFFLYFLVEGLFIFFLSSFSSLLVFFFFKLDLISLMYHGVHFLTFIPQRPSNNVYKLCQPFEGLYTS